ncbi:MAG: Crp/Fnr family transcriptional regulator [Saprospiraceae bacterium]|nr:Crp/Fnr family transcriptional regulator [Saprospiraceae bacterium]
MKYNNRYIKNSASMNPIDFQTLFPQFSKELIAELHQNATIRQIPKHTEVIRQGQFMNFAPIVLEGTVKIFTFSEEREMLLYYLHAKESCVMSLMSCLSSQSSRVFARTETDTSLALIPAPLLNEWLRKYPKLTESFFLQFNNRYLDLLETINQLVFESLDVRLYKYLKQMADLKATNEFRINHAEVAHDLGTSREVITRVLKKLEQEQKITQLRGKVNHALIFFGRVTFVTDFFFKVSEFCTSFSHKKQYKLW